MEIELPPVMQKIKFPSQANNIRLVEKLVDDVCAEIGVNEDKYGNILIALTEAVNNAIHHGNRLDPKKLTTIHCQQKNEKLTFLIKDEGLGFDYENLPDPTDPKNIEKPDGRGIYLMKHLSDSISFEDNGSSIELSFELSAN
ncbi:MAG: ATP-binding protein [Flavobacteriales bacterium]|jgi:serine/threonine-protein kinase RsbW|nr:ATP-binding protein [Flavobacteriales bacterium]